MKELSGEDFYILNKIEPHLLARYFNVGTLGDVGLKNLGYRCRRDGFDDRMFI